MKEIKKIEVSTGTFTLEKNGIIYSHPNPRFEGKIDLMKAVESVKAIEEICDGSPKPIIGFMADHEITDEARKYLLENIYVSCAALIANSFIAQMMANLIINFKKPPVPIRLFSNEEQALNWINEVQPANVKPLLA